MKSLKLITISLNLISSIAVADCDAVLNACDRALHDQVKVNALQKQIISDMAERDSIKTNEINELKEDARHWYKNPLIVGPISFSLGAIVVLLFNRARP